MTKIEWTQRPGTKGETWNPIRAKNKATGGTGHFCTKVSAGCQNCYAADFQKRFKNPARYAAQDAEQVDLFLDETVLMQPLRWKKPRTIFVCSMTDLFYEGHPIEWIWNVWAVMALAPQHTFIVLTKRISYANTALVNRLHMGDPAICKAINQIPAFLGNRKGALEMPLPNVWIGTSVEDQATADHRIPHLLNTPAVVRFISAEPLLGPLQIERWLNIAWQCSGCRGYFSGTWQRTCPDCGKTNYWCGSHKFNGRKRDKNPIRPPQSGQGLDWVICGGESGHKARPMHPDWARSLRDQCKASSVPFFFKQWGAWIPQIGAKNDISDNPEISKYVWKEWNPDERKWEDWPYPMWCDDLDPEQSVIKVGKKAAGRELDGQQHNDYPGKSHVQA